MSLSLRDKDLWERRVRWYLESDLTRVEFASAFGISATFLVPWIGLFRKERRRVLAKIKKLNSLAIKIAGLVLENKDEMSRDQLLVALSRLQEIVELQAKGLARLEGNPTISEVDP